ncbi:MAG: ATP-dependent metallopeptidase FtsH/Yme1/Tma family protein, partial [Oleiphilaceae bacterium]|nr:ATP-dependent metallopeptidase FtsH/Yme1/Tma family protein [Oleiphilaceae bacterium]
MNDLAKTLLMWLLIGMVLLSVFNSFSPSGKKAQSVTYSEFVKQVEQGNVTSVVMEGERIRGKTISGQDFEVFSPESDNKALVGTLLDNNVEIIGKPEEQPSPLFQIFVSWFPMLLLIGVWIYFMRQMQGGGGGRGAMSFGRSKARMLAPDQVKVTFADVAGVEEAKQEVSELVDFLKDPGKFQRLGG